MAESRGGMLHVVFSFFLGLVVVGFVAITMTTALPSPSYDAGQPASAYQSLQESWALKTSIILLITATAILVLSLLRTVAAPVISNGLLLGGVFTMVYALGTSLSSGRSWLRVIVAALALVVTLVIGYLRFRANPAAQGEAVPEAAGELSARLAAVEAKFDALAQALRR